MTMRQYPVFSNNSGDTVWTTQVLDTGLQKKQYDHQYQYSHNAKERRESWNVAHL